MLATVLATTSRVVKGTPSVRMQWTPELHARLIVAHRQYKAGLLRSWDDLAAQVGCTSRQAKTRWCKTQRRGEGVVDDTDSDDQCHEEYEEAKSLTRLVPLQPVASAAAAAAGGGGGGAAPPNDVSMSDDTIESSKPKPPTTTTHKSFEVSWGQRLYFDSEKSVRVIGIEHVGVFVLAREIGDLCSFERAKNHTCFCAEWPANQKVNLPLHGLPLGITVDGVRRLVSENAPRATWLAECVLPVMIGVANEWDRFSVHALRAWIGDYTELRGEAQRATTSEELRALARRENLMPPPVADMCAFMQTTTHPQTQAAKDAVVDAAPAADVVPTAAAAYRVANKRKTQAAEVLHIVSNAGVAAAAASSAAAAADQQSAAKKPRTLPAGLSAAELRAQLDTRDYDVLVARAVDAKNAMVPMQRTFEVRVDDAPPDVVKDFVRAVEAVGLRTVPGHAGLLSILV